MNYSKLFIFLLCFLCGFSSMAQEAEMAFELRQSGKIYVVVATIILIFAGFLIYLLRLERKIKKLEKEHRSLKEEQEK